MHKKIISKKQERPEKLQKNGRSIQNYFFFFFAVFFAVFFLAAFFAHAI